MLNLSKYTLDLILGLILVLVIIGASPHNGFAAESMTDARAQDLVAIQQLVVKYAHVYDALDVEGYVSVFAEDAQFTFPGNTLNGRADIRKFITAAKERRASAPATGPATKSYHSISNTMIEFVSDSEAHHRSYWQVLTSTAGGGVTVASVGVYEDVIVKQNGQWLIQKRTIPP
jgi:uncharacterized protein (TIGR02246 family)